MLRHTVLFKPKDDVTEQVFMEAMQNFATHLKQMNGLEALMVGNYESPEEMGASGAYSHGFSFDVAGEAELADFLQDKASEEVKAKLLALIEQEKNVGF